MVEIPHVDSWETLFAALDAATWRPYLTLPAGVVEVPEQEIAVDWEEYSHLEDEERWLDFDPPNGATMETLYSYLVDNVPGNSFGQSLEVLTIDEQTAYVSIWSEDAYMLMVRARLRPAAAPGLIGTWLKTAAQDATLLTAILFFANWPDHIYAQRTNLLTKEELREAYWAARASGVWETLTDDSMPQRYLTQAPADDARARFEVYFDHAYEPPRTSPVA